MVPISKKLCGLSIALLNMNTLMVLCKYIQLTYFGGVDTWSSPTPSYGVRSIRKFGYSIGPLDFLGLSQFDS